MNNMIWDAVLWLRKKLSKDKEDIIEAVNNIQNLFETSADATASSSDILAGKTAYNGTVLLTGTMKDRRGITVTAGATTQDDEYTYLSIPEEACYNANSKVRTPNSNIMPKLTSNFKISSGTFFDLSDIKKYQTIKLQISNMTSDATDWSSLTLYVYGDSTVIADIADFNEHIYNISAYNTVKIAGHYRGGAGDYAKITGRFSLQ